MDRKFVASAPNQLWVADVTYVPTVQGWLYLACVTDVLSRMVIGWSMASHADRPGRRRGDHGDHAAAAKCPA